MCAKLPQLIILIIPAIPAAALSLQACQSAPKRDPETALVGRLHDGSTVELGTSSKLTTYPTGASSPRFWYSTFPTGGAENAHRVIERRRALFLALFVDDRDPYTGKVVPRGRCLLPGTGSAVRFRCSAPPAWNDCAPAKADPPEFVREWVACGATVWEVTRPAPDASPIRWECAAQRA